MKIYIATLTLTLTLTLAASSVPAQDAPPPAAVPPTTEAPADTPAEPAQDAKVSAHETVTEHTGVFAGKETTYRASAGLMPLKADDGSVRANIFYIAYTACGASPKDRPIMFCFNGGPGSSSVWLHMGALGPKRAVIPDNGTAFPTPPFQLADNYDSILSDCDLVFIDPVSTGYSRPDKAKAEEFHNFDGDVAAVADFIRLYTTQHSRWNSPKYLAGESYGVIRAIALAKPLQSTQGMYLNGLILVSGLIDFATISDPNLAAISYLPSMTANAHFYGKLPADVPTSLVDAVKEATVFARESYASALHQGSNLSAENTERIAQQLSRLTGIQKAEILQQKLVLDPNLFRKQLLRDEGKIIGRFDGRVSAIDGNPAFPLPDADPSLDNVYGAYSTLLNAYLANELNYKSDLPYEILKSVGWDYSRFQNRFLNVGDTLVEAFQTNPKLKVLVTCGWHDLATPPEGIHYSINQLKLPADWKARIQTKFYEGGHMYYTSESSLKEFSNDLRAFLAAP